MPTSGSKVHLKFGTKASYNSATKDSQTIYFITDDKEIYLGEDKYSGNVDSSITGADRGLTVVNKNVGHSNATITATTTAVLTKIKYDTYGHLTGVASVTATDIPALPASKITSGTFADDRIASASTWNGKQDAIGTINATSAGKILTVTPGLVIDSGSARVSLLGEQFYLTDKTDYSSSSVTITRDTQVTHKAYVDSKASAAQLNWESI